jgi:hypothetical protein
MVEERVDGLLVTLHNVENAIGKPRFLKPLC